MSQSKKRRTESPSRQEKFADKVRDEIYRQYGKEHWNKLDPNVRRAYEDEWALLTDVDAPSEWDSAPTNNYVNAVESTMEKLFLAEVRGKIPESEYDLYLDWVQWYRRASGSYPHVCGIPGRTPRRVRFETSCGDSSEDDDLENLLLSETDSDEDETSRPLHISRTSLSTDETSNNGRCPGLHICASNLFLELQQRLQSYAPTTLTSEYWYEHPGDITIPFKLKGGSVEQRPALPACLDPHATWIRGINASAFEEDRYEDENDVNTLPFPGWHSLPDKALTTLSTGSGVLLGTIFAFRGSQITHAPSEPAVALKLFGNPRRRRHIKGLGEILGVCGADLLERWSPYECTRDDTALILRRWKAFPALVMRVLKCDDPDVPKLAEFTSDCRFAYIVRTNRSASVKIFQLRHEQTGSGYRFVAQVQLERGHQVAKLSNDGRYLISIAIGGHAFPVIYELVPPYRKFRPHGTELNWDDVRIVTIAGGFMLYRGFEDEYGESSYPEIDKYGILRRDILRRESSCGDLFDTDGTKVDSFNFKPDPDDPSFTKHFHFDSVTGIVLVVFDPDDDFDNPRQVVNVWTPAIGLDSPSHVFELQELHNVTSIAVHKGFDSDTAVIAFLGSKGHLVVTDLSGTRLLTGAIPELSGRGAYGLERLWNMVFCSPRMLLFHEEGEIFLFQF